MKPSAKRKRLLDVLLIAGSVFFLVGLSLTMTDGMNSSWCPSSNKKLVFDLRVYLNGPTLLILGFLMAIYPAFLQIRKWKKDSS